METAHEEVMEILGAYTDAFRMNEVSFPPELSTEWNQRLREIATSMEDLFHETLREAIDRGASLELTKQRMSLLFEKLTQQLLGEAAHQANRNYTFLLIQAYENDGHTQFRFVGEPGPNTCEDCATRMRKIYRLQELVEEDAIPPLHPNCRCWLETTKGERLDFKNLPADVNPFTGSAPVGGKFQILQGDKAKVEALRALEAAAGRKVDLYQRASINGARGVEGYPHDINVLPIGDFYTYFATPKISGVSDVIWDAVGATSSQMGDLADVIAAHYGIPAQPGAAIDAAISVASEFFGSDTVPRVHTYTEHVLVITYPLSRRNGDAWIRETHVFHSCEDPYCSHYQGVYVHVETGTSVFVTPKDYHYGENKE